jgi:uncharacterized protein YbbC (DUF1343 family)/CubicO group peptidase (beta-lactamase class C family)
MTTRLLLTTPLAAALAAMLAMPLRAQSFAGSEQLDAAIEEAIAKDQIPGAVLLVGHAGQIVHRKAYGSMALTPHREAMTTETVFDAASLTKVVATSSAILKLLEDGQIRLSDPVTKYLPEFQGGKSDVTLRQLVTHFSGLRPDLDLKPAWSGYDTGIRKALVEKSVNPPGTKFTYSDINFILLGEIVHKVTGKMLPDYVREKVFVPLGMNETMFQPPAAFKSRIAPTELVDGVMLRGVVHDETTRYMGGIAGHAGLFTTADDLAKFAEMMLGLGTRNGVRIFSPLSVRKATEPQTPSGQPVLRGLGWDMDSPYSGNRGELFPLGSYGHTGFTGTSLWIDPKTQSYVILLANSVHPQRRPPITSLRGRVATVVAAALGVDSRDSLLTGFYEANPGYPRTVNRNAETLTGLDVLVQQKFAPLAGKRVGLITNHTGLSRDGRRNVDLMLAAGIKVTALLSPEHGLAGREDHENVANSTDQATGLVVYSLYAGKYRRPNDEMMKNVDVLVFDIQDIGARFYTYICTMLNAMEEAARRKIPFYVLDRPNPITGVHVEGPMLDPELKSFVGCVAMPLRHGMTAAEIAQMANADQEIGAALEVVPMKNWQRGDWFDSTGLAWVDPSPNMRSLNAALLYPGVAMLESAKNYSVGRGTDSPFEQIGADWIRGRELAAYLNARQIPGVRVYPTQFAPTASNFSGKTVQGVRFVITDREAFQSVRLGIELGVALEKLYPSKIQWDVTERLIGNRSAVADLKGGKEPRNIEQALEESLRGFREHRAKFLLYR